MNSSGFVTMKAKDFTLNDKLLNCYKLCSEQCTVATSTFHFTVEWMEAFGDPGVTTVK